MQHNLYHVDKAFNRQVSAMYLYVYIDIRYVLVIFFTENLQNSLQFQLKKNKTNERKPNKQKQKQNKNKAKQNKSNTSISQNGEFSYVSLTWQK